MKDVLLSGLPVDLDFAEMSLLDLERFAQLHGAAFEAARLEELTLQLQDAGCRWLLDYRVTLHLMPDGSRQPPPPGFARLFAHPDRRFFAEVNQILLPGAPPMSVNILSHAGGDWSIETTGVPPFDGSAITYALRRPHAVWSRHPGLSPRELIDLHLARRGEIFYDLYLAVLNDVSAGAYFAHEKRACTLRRDQAARVDEAALMFDVHFSGDRLSWWGEYAAKFPDRAKALDNS